MILHASREHWHNPFLAACVIWILSPSSLYSAANSSPIFSTASSCTFYPVCKHGPDWANSGQLQTLQRILRLTHVDSGQLATLPKSQGITVAYYRAPESSLLSAGTGPARRYCQNAKRCTARNFLLYPASAFLCSIFRRYKPAYLWVCVVQKA